MRVFIKGRADGFDAPKEAATSESYQDSLRETVKDALDLRDRPQDMVILAFEEIEPREQADQIVVHNHESMAHLFCTECGGSTSRLKPDIIEELAEHPKKVESVNQCPECESYKFSMPSTEELASASTAEDIEELLDTRRCDDCGHEWDNRDNSDREDDIQ